MYVLHYTAANTRTGEVKEDTDINRLIDTVELQNFLNYFDYNIEGKVSDWKIKTEMREV